MSKSPVHIMFATRDRAMLCKTDEDRIDAYRRCLRIGTPFDLLVVNTTGDHGHAVVLCGPEAAARFAHDLECSLKLGLDLPVGFNRYHQKRVNDQGHLRSVVPYSLEQGTHHGKDVDPFHLGSNGPDLCGGRITGAQQRELLRTWLPELSPRRIERTLVKGGLRSFDELGPAPADLTGEALERRLLIAAASALGRSSLRRRDRWAGDARRALALICRTEPIGQTIDVARMLDSRPKSVTRLLKRGRPDEKIIAAVRWQVRFQLSKIIQLKSEGRMP